MPLPDTAFCGICDGDLIEDEKGRLKCEHCGCFALDLEPTKEVLPAPETV